MKLHIHVKATFALSDDVEDSTKFNLELPPVNNYINMILQSIKTYQLKATHQDSLGESVRSLQSLISILPPKGQDFLEAETDKMLAYESDDKAIKNHAELAIYFRKAMYWIWPNLMELHMNLAKPRWEDSSKLGSKKRE